MGNMCRVERSDTGALIQLKQNVFATFANPVRGNVNIGWKCKRSAIQYELILHYSLEVAGQE